MKHNHYIRVKPPPKPLRKRHTTMKDLTQAVRSWAGTNHIATLHTNRLMTVYTIAPAKEGHSMLWVVEGRDKRGHYYALTTYLPMEQ